MSTLYLQISVFDTSFSMEKSNTKTFSDLSLIKIVRLNKLVIIDNLIIVMIHYIYWLALANQQAQRVQRESEGIK